MRMRIPTVTESAFFRLVEALLVASRDSASRVAHYIASPKRPRDINRLNLKLHTERQMLRPQTEGQARLTHEIAVNLPRYVAPFANRPHDE